MAHPTPRIPVTKPTILAFLAVSICGLVVLPACGEQHVIGLGVSASVSSSRGVIGASVGAVISHDDGAGAGSVPEPHHRKPGVNSSAPGHGRHGGRHGRWRRKSGHGIPDSRAAEFLSAHNKVRASVNEPPVHWDNHLARYAHRYASKRALDCNMVHSGGPYGENIFWGEKDEWSPAQIVDSWASENQYYDKSKNSCAAGEMCLHYTQLVWMDSTKIGCAKVTCLNGGIFATCNYDPPGNYVDESPFKHGPANR